MTFPVQRKKLAAPSRAIAVLLAGTMLTATSGAATTLQWNIPGSGDWFDPVNWTPTGPPQASDVAAVNNGGTAEVTDAQTPTVGTLQIGAGPGHVSGAVTTATADLALGGGSALTVGFANGPDAAAEGALSVGGSIVGIATSTAFGTYSVGTALGNNAKASGSVEVGGNLAGTQGFVGTLGEGAGISAEGHLSVGGHLTGLRGVGFASAVSTDSVATGNVTVTGGDLVPGTGTIDIGIAFGTGSTAVGTVSVEAGDLRTAPSFMSIGVARNGTATGVLDAAGVDSTDAALAALVVGAVAPDGIGSASGRLTLGRGDLRLAGNASIGTASGDGGGTAQGMVTLGDALLAEGSSRSLRVGSAAGATQQAAPGSAMGVLSADGVSGFRNLFVGVASGSAALGPEAEGTLTVGAGGLVNGTDPGGVLSIGRAEAQVVNLQVTGPGPVATGTATVGGDISGYDFVRVGTAENSGTATGTLALGVGTLTTTGLFIGEAFAPVSSIDANDAVGTAVGLVEVNGGTVVVANPEPLFGGITRIGAVATGQDADHSAKGTLSLTSARLDSGGAIIGLGQGADGTLQAKGSDLNVGFMTLGGPGGIVSGGTGSVMLTDSTLTTRADPDRSFSGALVLRAGQTAVTATDSDIVLDGSLSILRAGGNALAGDTARMSMDGGRLGVGGDILIGDFRPDSRGELVLGDVSASVGGDVSVGESANLGALFGDALLQLDASLMEIAGGLFLDLGGELRFGVSGLVRGLGGYGAFDALSTTLRGGNARVDFAGLTGPLGFEAAEFDFIKVKDGFLGDFGLVSLLNIPTGYSASHGFTDTGDTWRVTLSRNVMAIPLPAGGWLLLSGLAGLVLCCRRRAA